jgi:hypothetical protein
MSTSFSVDVNKRLPIVGIGSHHGINCYQWATMIWELINNIIENNIEAHRYLILTITILFCYK